LLADHAQVRERCLADRLAVERDLRSDEIGLDLDRADSWLGASSLYAATRTPSISSSGLPRSGSLWIRWTCFAVVASTALMLST